MCGRSCSAWSTRGRVVFALRAWRRATIPAFLVVKTLDLEFTWMTTVHVLGTDPELIDLVPPRHSQPPAAMIRTNEQGTTVLEVREPGELPMDDESGPHQRH